MTSERRVIVESVLAIPLGAGIGWFPFKWTVDVFPDPWAAVMWWLIAAAPAALWVVIRSRAGVLDSPVGYHFAAGATVGLAAWLVVGLAAVGLIVVSSIMAPCRTGFGIPGPSCGLYSFVFWGLAWLFTAILPAATVGMLAAVFGYVGWKLRGAEER